MIFLNFDWYDYGCGHSSLARSAVVRDWPSPEPTLEERSQQPYPHSAPLRLTKVARCEVLGGPLRDIFANKLLNEGPILSRTTTTTLHLPFLIDIIQVGRHFKHLHIDILNDLPNGKGSFSLLQAHQQHRQCRFSVSILLSISNNSRTISFEFYYDPNLAGVIA